MERLADPPRRVPVRLWLRLVLGQWLVQLSAGLIGVLSFLFAALLTHGPDDPPLPLVGSILVIGCIPLFGVGLGRARRVLYMLRKGRETDAGALVDPQGEQKTILVADIPRPGFVLHLLVLPLGAVAGMVALIVRS
ncbi:MAG TPA: hypothetical protein VLB44_21925 [Kofleriaceae bacterium]|nr:hypothetical protein [Kofleriaceae bacterium]